MRKTLIALALATTISNVAFAHPFQETVYHDETYVKVNNEHGRAEALLDITNCTKHKYSTFTEYQGEVHFVDCIRKVTIRFFKGKDDDWALIKYDNEDFFTELRVDDPMLVNLYYFMKDFAKERIDKNV